MSKVVDMEKSLLVGSVQFSGEIHCGVLALAGNLKLKTSNFACPLSDIHTENF